MAQIFVSHASKDDNQVTEFSNWLKSECHDRLFVDHLDIPAGTSWDHELPRQAKRADILLLYVTRNWLESDECFAEYRSAFYDGKIVIPLFVGDVISNGSPEVEQRFQTLCGSVQGIPVDSFPFEPVSSALLLGSIEAAAKKIAWDRRRRVLRRGAVFLILLAAILIGLGLIYRDNVVSEFRKIEILWAFEGLAVEEAKRLAQTASDRSVEGRTFRECSSSDICPEMTVVPGGQFTMGDSDEYFGEESEQPATNVNIPAFAVSTFEVTLSQWSACNSFTQLEVSGPKCKDLPALFGTKDYPAALVTWDEAKAYVAWLNQRINGSEDGPYRLLSEAEWEYASRGVQSLSDPHTLYHWGNAPEDACAFANARNKEMPDSLEEVIKGLDCPNNPVVAAKVGRFEANAFGLKDMAGNVAEWVEDCWHDDYSQRPTDARAWVTGVDLPCDRVIRGGSWAGETDNLRNSARSKLAPDMLGFNIGFRVARDLDAD